MEWEKEGLVYFRRPDFPEKIMTVSSSEDTVVWEAVGRALG